MESNQQTYQGPIMQQPGAIYQHNDPNYQHSQPVTIIEVREPHHHKDSYDKIPAVSSSLAIVILIFNIFTPGWGTFIMAFSSRDHCGYWVLIGLLQFILFPLIIGWVWAIITSVQVCKKSTE